MSGNHATELDRAAARDLGKRDRRSWRGALEALCDALGADERVAAVCVGFRGLEKAALAVTDRRVVVHDAKQRFEFLYAELVLAEARERFTGGRLLLRSERQRVELKTIVPASRATQIAGTCP